MDNDIEDPKRKFDRPYSNPKDILKLIDDCEGNIEKAANIIIEENRKWIAKNIFK